MPDQPPAGKIEPSDAETEPRDAEAKPRVGISRREFARRAALASAVVTIAPVVAVSAPSIEASVSVQDKPATPRSAAVAPQNPAPNAPRLSAESQAEADARFQTILVLYGTRFSDEQKMDLHRLCSVSQPALDHVRAYKIENGDGPALYLKPQYEREKKPKAPAVAAAKTATGKGAPSAKTASPAGAPKKP
ncbi:MAG TPA: hypothetical protein VGJ06_04020 [Candidatus Acidoferrum sp.]|jgi:hypothetical protein